MTLLEQIILQLEIIQFNLEWLKSSQLIKWVLGQLDFKITKGKSLRKFLGGKYRCTCNIVIIFP